MVIRAASYAVPLRYLEVPYDRVLREVPFDGVHSDALNVPCGAGSSGAPLS